MSNEIELISDGDGLAVIGNPADVEEFLESLALNGRSLPTRSTKLAADNSSGLVSSVSEIKKSIGSWVKLTEETIGVVEELGLMPSKASGITTKFLTKTESLKGWTQITEKASSVAANPALLTGVAGVMAQTALQASLDEITQYLENIDRKLDDVIRSQTNAVLARVDGVRFAVNEANAIKEAVGKVSDVTWSKIQNSSTTLFETESYALRQIQDEAHRINLETPLADMYQAIKSVETNIPMWLTILANCASLYDSIAILELDRVMDTYPDDLDNHRIGLKAARTNRLGAIAMALETILGKVSESVERANAKVLFNPLQTPKTVESCRSIALTIIEISVLFGISTQDQSSEARKWVDAASERIEATRKVTADTAVAVQHISKEAASTAKLLKGKVSDKLAERKRRPADDE
jgi:hypothetical protein